MNPFFIASISLRYLRSKKSSRFLSFITWLSLGGVTIGVTAMIVTLCVMDGFEQELKKRLISTDLHILIEPTEKTESFDAGFVSKSVFDENQSEFQSIKRDVRVKEIWPVVSTEAILRSGTKITGVVLKGMSEERLSHFQKQIVETAEKSLLFDRQGADSIKLPGILMGQELAYELAIIPGDLVTLISPTEMEGPLSNIPRFKKFVVEAVYKSGLPEQELHTVFSKEANVLSFLKKRDVVSSWEVTVSDFDQAGAVAKTLSKKMPDLRVRDWITLNSNLFFSLKLERFAMFIILAFIVIVASFNIVTTLTLMVLEKKKEIAILKTMGMTSFSISRIFIGMGLFIGGIGVGGGSLLAYVLSLLIKRYEFIKLPDVYYDRTLPVAMNGFYYVLVSAATFSIVLIACLYPARRASRLEVLDSIRV